MTDFPPSLFAGHRYAVLGLGRNGNASVRALAAMGAEVTAWDDTQTARESLGAPPPGVTLTEIRDVSGLDALVLSPGIPHILPHAHPVAAAARAAGVPILSDAELLYRAVRAAGSKARFAAVTGTNGKSTTTVLLAHLLAHAGRAVQAGGNLGPAALALPLLPDDGVYVLEMSSYMLERLDRFHADVACLLNLTPDHIDRHGDMTGYAAAKAHVFDHQTAADMAFIGMSDRWSDAIATDIAQRGVPVRRISGSDPRADLYGADHLLRDAAGVLADLTHAPSLRGAHNAENAAAAVGMALFLGVPRAGIATALASFSGLAHRLKTVRSVDGVTFVDDSKATNADAASRALGCYDRLIWIAGGLAKEGGIESLTPFFPRVAEALLIGQDAQVLAATLAAHNVAHRVVGTLDAAVGESFKTARALSADTVLLSPACASFDQFRSFEHRGLRFIELVDALVPSKSAQSPGA